MAPLRGSLLFPRREGAVELTVYEEVGQYPAWTPGYPVCPSLDAGCGLFVDENVPTDNELVSFTIVRPAEAVGQRAGEAGFEDDQSIFGCLNMTPPCWCTRRCFASIHGTEASADAARLIYSGWSLIALSIISLVVQGQGVGLTAGGQIQEKVRKEG